MKNYQELQERLNWLQNEDNQLSCEDVLAAHLLKDVEVIETEGKPLEKTWAEIDKLMDKYQYEFYVSFEIDEKSSDILDLVLISKFILNPPCYSTNLFRCIAQEHKLNADSKIVFFNADITGEKKMVIKVEDGTAVSLYDLSVDPI